MSDETSTTTTDAAAPQWRDVPVDWEALEDAFENNAPEVHSYLHVPTGDVLRIVDGVADPQMHARIAADPTYLRVEPVSSREQYRWMERYIPMVEDKELQEKLARAIDGKGAFRRFKDVLMTYGPDREKWFAFRSERLRIFMEAWLNAHALNPTKRVVWPAESPAQTQPVEAAPPTVPGMDRPSQPSVSVAPRSRSVDSLRRRLRDVVEALGPRELDQLTAFGEFLQARRAAARLHGGAESQPSLAGALEGFDDAEIGGSNGGAPTTPETARPSSATVARRKLAAT
ncbi:MAG: hypothetical protein FJ096_00150 [Deltaproteobacteria bacterium]|nr:hypothetical protein [Deltaproteobacteria bacterium]